MAKGANIYAIMKRVYLAKVTHLSV